MQGETVWDDYALKRRSRGPRPVFVNWALSLKVPRPSEMHLFVWGKQLRSARAAGLSSAAAEIRADQSGRRQRRAAPSRSHLITSAPGSAGFRPLSYCALHYSRP